MRLLIAEDDRVTRLSLEAFAKRSGYDVVSVSDGRSALAIMGAENPPPLMLIDWVMPEMDGVDLLKAVRGMELFPQPYIVMLTAKTDVDDIVHALESGANDFVSKPYQPDELKARLRVGQMTVERELAIAQRWDDEQPEALLDADAIIDILQLELIHYLGDDASLCVALIRLEIPEVQAADPDDESHQELFQECANRIRPHLNSRCFLGQFDEDRFVVVAALASSDGQSLFNRVCDGISSESVTVNDVEAAMRCTIGVAKVDGETDASTLISRAEEALDRAAAGDVVEV